jgi:hypothetical protein
MNEQQKQWLESIKKLVEEALTTGTASDYETCVDKIHMAVDTCPEP